MSCEDITDLLKVKTNLESPTGPKLKRKTSAEPTMTFHTRAATDEIYGIFNQPLKTPETQDNDDESGPESDDDDDYTSAGESTGTGRISCTSEAGGEDETEMKSVSEWSEFTGRKHIPEVDTTDGQPLGSEDVTQATDAEVTGDQEAPAQILQPSDALITPTSPEAPSVMTKFIPIPPEDYEAPTQPFRDAAQCSQNRLPFMTPIVEKTESSLALSTVHEEKDYFNSKTPSRSNVAATPDVPKMGNELWSSPFQEIINNAAVERKPVPAPALIKPAKADTSNRAPKAQTTARGLTGGKDIAPKGPIVKDAQCNPVDEVTRQTILDNLQPPLASYDGFFDRKTEIYGKGSEIRKYGKAVAKLNKSVSDRSSTSLSAPPVLQFQGADRDYLLRRELGKGAFAPVYLVEAASTEEPEEDAEDEAVVMGKGKFGLGRQKLEALKMEESPTPWEFYIMRQAKRRLGVSRAANSIIHAYEMHLFADECYLVEEYLDQGTLLDLVNIAKADTTGPTGGVMDEQLAIFFTIELLRVVEGLHAKGLMHGDLKADNCLVRLCSVPDASWTPRYRRDGTGGWDRKGVALIDLGRGIDMRAFRPDVQFIADWPTGPADCAEMREMRPWTFQLDYHGLAGIVHSMLFGRYIETVAERGAALGSGATRTYRLAEKLKRYWQAELWEPLFGLLLNPLQHLAGEEAPRMPVLRGLRGCREAMEAWLEANSERGGGLKGALRRMEEKLRERKR